MNVLRVEWVLLDIEGTTSNLSFVHEVLFPYAQERMAMFLSARGSEAAVREALDQVARDAGVALAEDWCPVPLNSPEGVAWVVAHLHALMDRDAKVTGLKLLQGMIWEGGFRDGTLRSHVFGDVREVLQAWSAAGIRLGVYSSGSVAAQKLYFAHTIEGDLGGYFARHFDTSVGGKRESASYGRIAGQLGVAPDRVLFVSDVAEELDAAAAAGMQAVLAERPGNRPVASCPHRRVRALTELRLERALASA